MVRRILAAALTGLVAVGGLAAPARAAAARTVIGSYHTATGTPIAGAQVAVYSAEDAQQGSTVVTDTAGRFTVANVAASSVKVRFRQGFRVQWAHRQPDAASATVFTMPADEALTVDELRTPDGVVEGTFTTTDGRPVQNGLVTVHDLARNARNWVSTGADGRYRIEQVQSGPIKLEFTKGGREQWAYEANDFASATTLQVPDGGTLTVDQALLPTGTIEGVLSTPLGAPLENPYIAAFQEGGMQIDGNVQPDGRYTIDVPAGRWKIVIDTDVTGAQYVPQKTGSADATAFTVVAGQSLRVDEQLRPVGAIAGVLTRYAGTQVRDANVKLYKDGRVIDSQYTPEDAGDYYFRGLEPGDYLVSYSESSTTELWVPGTLRRDEAEVLTVRPWEKTDGSTRIGAPSALRGRLTLPDGAPIADFPVRIESTTPGYSNSTYTESDGTWSFDRVVPEDYRVSFGGSGSGALRQWAYGKATAAEAEVFTLRSGQTTTVDDTWVLSNALKVSAVDAVDGSPAPGFCATIGDRPARYCTDTAELSIPGLSPGPTTVSIKPSTKSDHLPREGVPVTVDAAGPSAVTVPLDEGGRVRTEIVARATGNPAWGFCVVLVPPGQGTSELDDLWNCTHKNGKITTYAVPEGTYQMFVFPSRSYLLGAQWVGESGGTGDQKQAVKFKVRKGKTTRLPQVLLDPSGRITGTIRDAAGAPMANVNVSTGAWALGGGSPPSQQTYTDGKYTLWGLGPYAWPLQFTSRTGTVPRQWSGGTGNRFQAATTTVTSGQDATFDTTLVAGARLTGTVTGSFTKARITAVNAATGDVLAIADLTGADPVYDMPIIGGGSVLLRWTADGASGAWPDKVSVPRSGTKTVDLTIPGS